MPRLFSSEGVRLRNRAAILKTIRERVAISRSEIARTLRLSPSTVSRLVDELLTLGLIVEGAERGHSTRRGGRRSIALELNPTAGYLVGVDLGGTNMVGGLADLNGEILVRRSTPSKLKMKRRNYPFSASFCSSCRDSSKENLSSMA